MGDGKQWMPWIHQQDLINIILFLVKNKKISGAVNGTAPNPVTNKELTKILGGVLKRPTLIPMPKFLLKLMLGEMAEELLLSGRRVIPKKVLDAGYKFRFSQLENALIDII